MRIGFVVNRLRRLRSSYTTTHLAAAAVRAGWRALFIDIDGFTLDPGGRLLARVHATPDGLGDPRELTAGARSGAFPVGLVDLACLDALVLRNNPVRSTVLDFARALRDRGVLVLNDPDGIARGAGKLALEWLPAELRPRTLVSSDERVLRGFLADLGGPAVLKPVRGFGGKGVKRVDPGDPGGVTRALAELTGSGARYVIAQESIPGAERGDKRILLADGEPVGCYVRMRGEGEFRHNVHVGGAARPARLDRDDRIIVSTLAPRLRRDGIFLAGLDVIGGRAVEVNVVAPGGIANIEGTGGGAIADPLVARLIRRIADHPRGDRPHRGGADNEDIKARSTMDGGPDERGIPPVICPGATGDHGQ